MTDFDKFCKQYPDHAEEATERAAIMEFDGGMDRETAELCAILRMKKKYGERNDKATD